MTDSIHSTITLVSDLDSLQSAFIMQASQLNLNVSVPPDGRFDSTLAIVGEGAGVQEVEQHLPFVGATGRRLWDLLRSQQLARPDFYITNVIKRQFSSATNPRYPVPVDEVLKWRSMLAWELRCLPNLKYILALGNEAMLALTGFNGITNRRGSTYPCTIPGLERVKVVCTFNPAHVMRNPQVEISLLLDIERFASTIRTGGEEYTIHSIINPSYSDAMDYINKLKSDGRPVSFDIETPGGETGCYGIGNDPHEAMCISLRTRTANRYTVEEEYKIRLAIQSLAESTQIIAQNGNFDATWCGYKDLLHIPVWFDTMLAHHTLYPLLPHGLDYIVSQYTNHPYYKDDRAKFKEGGDIDEYWRYNCKDVALTYECHIHLLQELREQKLAEFFFNHVMHLDPHLARITMDGLAVDRKVRARVAGAVQKDLDRVENEFYEIVERALDLPPEIKYRPNPSSPKQMAELYYDQLNLPGYTRTVDKEQRATWLASDKVNYEAKLILQRHNNYARDRKFLSNYAKMRIDPDGRVRYIYSQIGVSSAPGRLSSSATLWGTGGNMQNQPERAKEFYVADPDTVMFYFDLSQAEARMVAWHADIPKWKEQFERARREPGSYDAHRALAADMFKVPYDKTPKEDWVVVDGIPVMTMRYKAKRCRHGLNYRMGYQRLAETTGMDLYEAQKCFVMYHHETPEIRKWWKQLEYIVKTKRELWTPLGRRFRILQRIDDSALESIVAFVPQSTIGDKIKQVMYRVQEHDDWDMNKMRVKLNIHDALLGIAKKSHVMKALKICKRIAEEPIMVTDVYERSTEPLIIPADCKISKPDKHGVHRWSTLEKVKL